MNPTKIKMNNEEAEILEKLLDSETWVVLNKFMLSFHTKYEQHLIQYPLSDGAEKLVQEKARVEGSARLINELNSYRNLLRSQKVKKDRA